MKVSDKAPKEYAAGYQSGLAGEPAPWREKGQSFYGGWMNGNADRVEQAQPGHLAQGGAINLSISEQGRKKLSDSQKARYAAEKVKPVDLGWKQSSKSNN